MTGTLFFSREDLERIVRQHVLQENRNAGIQDVQFVIERVDNDTGDPDKDLDVRCVVHLGEVR